MSDTMPRPVMASPAIDRQQWPDIAGIPASGVRSWLARKLFQSVVGRLGLRVLLPDGHVLGAGGLTGPVMRLENPDAFYRRLGAGGLIGFGESYMAQDWTAEDLSGVLTVFAEKLETLVPPPLQRLRDVYVQHQPTSDRGTLANTRNNVARHYDLSNELFALFLDETMTYSAALFPEDGLGQPLARADRLADAQRRKVDRLLDAAQVHTGSSVLEIGTGWGELSLRAAERGARVRSITLSEEQRSLALQRVAGAGLSDRITIDLCDYRAVDGSYDAVLSVEMVEAVGYQYWPTYFGTLARLLAPGGRVGLQAITMPHDRMLASRDTYTWIHKYIFPGGLIPSVSAIEDTAVGSGLRITDRFGFGAHYAETLRLWQERFVADSDGVDELGFGFGFNETFRRMWRLYLAYSEAGFRSGYLDVYQFVLEKGQSEQDGVPNA